jgi:hypothetical protein
MELAPHEPALASDRDHEMHRACELVYSTTSRVCACALECMYVLLSSAISCVRDTIRTMKTCRQDSTCAGIKPVAIACAQRVC